MTEYIDKKPFLDKLLYMGYFDDNDEIKEVADSFTVADVVERSKIDKAVEDIEHYKSMLANPYNKKGMERALEIFKRDIRE